ncbi:Alg9-like mannosyltransferase family-domain-containing protein [Absidia repens]|uniref:Mannosyltransferase n=1 Tax=Absidia repens TaxID=90262 RepID=A0A1X2IBI4_9FUNG|nr:Alg9-like mannosyltransferase family-domain-containing protein [Absidia repens]
MIYYLSVGGVIFRFEVGILLVILMFYEIVIYRSLDWFDGTVSLLKGALPGLVLSVIVDSWFWQTWLWPEGKVFYFNAILNKSSEWGVLPYHAYITQFLPRLLMISYPLAIISLVLDSRTRQLLLPMISYIVVFSLLPHKEWRFIMYVIPVFTAAAANTVSKTWIKATGHRQSNTVKAILIMGISGGVFFSLFLTTLLLKISQLNYPGGEALSTLHKLQRNDNGNTAISIHMDVKTAMTGASRFGQLSYPKWSYSKNESHSTLDDFLTARYTHLITATPPTAFAPDYTVIAVTRGLERIRPRSIATYLNDAKAGRWARFLQPLDIDLQPSLYILALTHPQKSWIQHTINKHAVVLYSKSYCPYCRGAKQLLNQYCVGQQLYVVEVDHLQDGTLMKQALKELSGQSTFPNLFVGSKSLGGFDNITRMDQHEHSLAEHLFMNGCTGVTKKS